MPYRVIVEGELNPGLSFLCDTAGICSASHFQNSTLNEVVGSTQQTPDTFPEPSLDRTIINTFGAYPPCHQPNPEQATIRNPRDHNKLEHFFGNIANIISYDEDGKWNLKQVVEAN